MQAQAVRHWLLTMEPQVQSQIISCEIHDGWSGPGAGSCRVHLLFPCQSLFCNCFMFACNCPPELCDCPDQVAHYRISTQHLTCHRLRRISLSMLNFASLKNVLVLAIVFREQNESCVGLQLTVNYTGSIVWFITNMDIILFYVLLNCK
jgi:hypothetical protein